MSTPKYTQLPLDFEIWKSIPSFEGFYEASNTGQIKRLKHGKGSRGEHVMQSQIDRNGYRQIQLYRDGIKHCLHVAPLVASAFFGPCPQGLEVNHIDGDKTNNCIENLEYVTRSENQKHAYAHRLHAPKQGEDHWKSKLTETQVYEIRRLLAEDQLTTIEIGKMYGVNNVVISHINRGKIWRHVPYNGTFPIRSTNRRNATLTAEEVAQIRQMLADGFTQREIAANYGVGPHAISKIKTGARWRHS